MKAELHQNPQCISLEMSSLKGVNLNRRILDRILYVVDSNVVP